MTTLVVGATGLLGSSICARLREEGIPARALVRPGSGRESMLHELGVESVYGDLKAPATLADACRGADAVVSTATSIVSRRSGDSLKRVDRDGQLALVEAAREAKVRRYIFVSARFLKKLPVAALRPFASRFGGSERCAASCARSVRVSTRS